MFLRVLEHSSHSSPRLAAEYLRTITRRVYANIAPEYFIHNKCRHFETRKIKRNYKSMCYVFFENLLTLSPVDLKVPFGTIFIFKIIFGFRKQRTE